jgi:prefoldin subunit 5
MAEPSSESEVLAQELEHVRHRVDSLEARIAEVEEVIPRLEAAAQTTARGMEEISSHWDAVYRAMRRAE